MASTSAPHTVLTPVDRISQMMILSPYQKPSDYEDVVMVVTDRNLGYQEVRFAVHAWGVSQVGLREIIVKDLRGFLVGLNPEWVVDVEEDNDDISVRVAYRDLLGAETTGLVLQAVRTVIRATMPDRRFFALRGDQRLALIHESCRPTTLGYQTSFLIPGQIELVDGTRRANLNTVAAHVARSLIGDDVRATVELNKDKDERDKKGPYRLVATLLRPGRFTSDPQHDRAVSTMLSAFRTQAHIPSSGLRLVLLPTGDRHQF